MATVIDLGAPFGFLTGPAAYSASLGGGSKLIGDYEAERQRQNAALVQQQIANAQSMVAQQVAFGQQRQLAGEQFARQRELLGQGEQNYYQRQQLAGTDLTPETLRQGVEAGGVDSSGQPVAATEADVIAEARQSRELQESNRAIQGDVDREAAMGPVRTRNRIAAQAEEFPYDLLTNPGLMRQLPPEMVAQNLARLPQFEQDPDAFEKVMQGFAERNGQMIVTDQAEVNRTGQKLRDVENDDALDSASKRSLMGQISVRGKAAAMRFEKKPPTPLDKFAESLFTAAQLREKGIPLPASADGALFTLDKNGVPKPWVLNTRNSDDNLAADRIQKRIESIGKRVAEREKAAEPDDPEPFDREKAWTEEEQHQSVIEQKVKFALLSEQATTDPVAAQELAQLKQVMVEQQRAAEVEKVRQKHERQLKADLKKSTMKWPAEWADLPVDEQVELRLRRFMEYGSPDKIPPKERGEFDWLVQLAKQLQGP